MKIEISKPDGTHGVVRYKFGEHVAITSSGGLRCLGPSCGSSGSIMRIDWWSGHYGGSVKLGYAQLSRVHVAEAWISSTEDDYTEITQMISALDDGENKKLRRKVTNKLFEAMIRRMQGRHLLALCFRFEAAGATRGRLEKQRELQRVLGV